MAYSKTTWQNNVTDIDANNLNKIEQGIYNNSLVVDAVTNTLNPTDTETYKTAELTEGQITDVIGVSDIIIKGQTSQDGTPTPSAPVDVNVVSGSNVVNTGNENLFPLILNIDGTSILQQRCNVIIQKDEFVFTATGTDMYFGNVAAANNAYQELQGKLIKIPEGAENIYLKVSNNAFSNNFICFFGENKISLGYSNISGSKEIPSTAKYFTVRIGMSNSVSGTTYRTKVMISTMDKAYVPHQGKELPLDLPVENLFDEENVNKIDCLINNGTKTISNYSGCKTLYIPIKGEKTYTVSKKVSARFVVGSCSSLPANNVVCSNTIQDNNAKSLTLTTNANDTYLAVFYYLSGTDTLTEQEILDSIQIELGSKANRYTSFGTTPIELCKIGNYQDYFYKSGSKWYLHKEIGKVVLDGSENWSGLTDLGDCIRVNTSFRCKYYQQFSDYFKYNDSYSLDEEHFYNYSNYFYVFLSKTKATTIEEFKTWLSNHNTTIYYVLETLTDTEITNTTLISQLEAIYNAPLYEQTNITQTNNDLPMVLDITACKDNINGIKAFIRK